MKEDNKQDTTYEYNSFQYRTDSIFNSIFQCGVYDYFNKEEIRSVLRNPIEYHETAIRLSNFVYTKNGVVANSIDYMVALPCLDSILINKSKAKKKNNNKAKNNKRLMRSTLDTIRDKHFIRDALHTEMLNGIAFYYFEVKVRPSDIDNTKYMNDFDVERIMEINDLGMNIAIISLPWQYCKIVGRRNGRNVVAFDLRYFDTFEDDTIKRKLKKYPEEIRKGYYERKNTNGVNGNWLILNSDKTMCKKIKCKDSEPWGRSLVISALEDVLYRDYFIDTKRNVLDELNNKIVYQTFPEGKEKGLCALTKKQQENQHNDVKNAVVNKNNKGGLSFFSVAAGTKINSLDVSTDIFNDKNESNLNNQISLDLGICASLLGAMESGNFATTKNNLEIITAQLYTWIYEWQDELNYVINANVIKDSNNRVEVYYFPTSFVNKKDFFDMMKALYSEASGSLTYLIASAGINPESYFSVLDQEIEDKIYQKYLPHQTSWTVSSKEGANAIDSKVGRPLVDDPTNDNTIRSKSAGANEVPRASV